MWGQWREDELAYGDTGKGILKDRLGNLSFWAMKTLDIHARTGPKEDSDIKITQDKRLTWLRTVTTEKAACASPETPPKLQRVPEGTTAPRGPLYSFHTQPLKRGGQAMGSAAPHAQELHFTPRFSPPGHSLTQAAAEAPAGGGEDGWSGQMVCLRILKRISRELSTTT